MKKIIVVAVAMCAAMIANAAAFTWTTSTKAYAPDAEYFANGTFVNGQHYGVKSNNDSSMKDIGEDYGIVWTYVLTLGAGATADEIPGTIDTYSSRAIKANLSSDLVKQTDPATVLPYSIVITGTGKDKKGNSITLVSDAIAADDWTVQPTGDIKLSTVAPSGWTVTVTSDVPEPTSGLLLLLGMAGLALRRKIA